MYAAKERDRKNLSKSCVLKPFSLLKDHDELDPETLREHEALTKVKKINKIRLGKYQIETWYYSPFPPEYDDCEELLFCEFCLTFLKRELQLKRHMKVS